MKQSKIYPSLVLGCICLAVALLLSVINMFTSPIIADRANQLADGAKTEVLPGGKGFEDITADFEFPSAVSEAFAADIGYVFRVTGKGRNGDIVVMVGIDSEGKVTGTKIISEGESNGYKEKVFTRVQGTDGEYTGMTLDTFAPVVASGATLTSNGFADAMKAALQAFSIANGVAVDTRTPEEILQDNCNAALGTTGVKYTKWFATEEITGIDSVYESEAGRVYVIGESFVGIKADGTVSGDENADARAKATAADTVIKASTLTEITDLTGLDADITKAYVTASGNYVFVVLGRGYKYESNYEFVGIEEGEMEIKIAISSEGKIIDVFTVSHKESKGFGDVCATEDYYEQYRGAENDDIVITVPSPDFHDDQISSDCTDIGAISSSTFTSTGYQTAVKVAFEAFEILTTPEGGND